MRMGITCLLAVCVSLSLAACGKTLEQTLKTGGDLLGIAGKIYEDVTENVKAVKDALKPAVAPVAPTK